MPPRRPTFEEVARTALVAGTGLVPLLARLAVSSIVPAPSTGTIEGMEEISRVTRRLLGRLGLDLEIEGVERVPRDGGLVFMWNQESHLDHLILAAALPRPFFSLINNEFSRFPFYGAYMRATGHVHVDRKDEAQWRGAIAGAADRVRAGETILISPEGTRSADGRLLPMKRGAFMLATSAGQPVVCSTVIGGHDHLPRHSAIVRKGTVRVVFSAPFSPGADPGELAATVAGVFERTKAHEPLLW